MQNETQISAAICDYLEYRKVFFWRANNIPVSTVTNDGKRVFRRMSKYTPKGIADILAIKGGVFYALEVKRETPKTYQTPEQKVFQENIEKNGGKYYVVRSIDDVQKIGL